MPSYDFTKLKKANKHVIQGYSKCMAVRDNSISVAGDIFDTDEVTLWLKFDVDKKQRAIRIRRGTEHGKRSFSLCRNGGKQSFACAMPKSLRETNMPQGIYKLDPATTNVFILN